jgi:transcriptional regulator with XRE-family HTH domain
MTNLKELLSNNLKIYRNNCGLSQSKLAERVDTATNYIAAIEAGRRFPSVKMLEKIAFALKIDTPELFSMKLLPIRALKLETAFKMETTFKLETEEHIWVNVKQKIDKFMEENILKIKKEKKKKP